jgi:hypothetical protein
MATRFILLVCFLTLNKAVFSQNIELFDGINYTRFYDNIDIGHYNSSYTAQTGHSIGIGLDGFDVKGLPWRFTLQYERYRGKIEASDGGLGGGYTTTALIDNSIISLGFFPINFQVFKALNLNLGLMASRLIKESFEGTQEGWALGQPSWSSDLQDEYEDFSAQYAAGAQGRIAYDFTLTKSIQISPQYSYYFEFSKAFKHFPKATKAMRHFLGFGFKFKIK